MASASSAAASIAPERMLDDASLPALEHDVMGAGVSSSQVLRAVLKQYAFSPDKYQAEVVHRALIKAIMLLPEEAFLQCLYLLPEARHSDAAVVQLKSLMEMLQTGRFARVWTLLGSKDLRVKLDAVAGFDDSIREYVATALEISHTRCPAEVVATSLGLGADAAAGFRGEWARDGDVVVFPPRPETEERKAALEAPLAYADVAELAKALAH